MAKIYDEFLMRKKNEKDTSDANEDTFRRALELILEVRACLCVCVTPLLMCTDSATKPCVAARRQVRLRRRFPVRGGLTAVQSARSCWCPAAQPTFSRYTYMRIENVSTPNMTTQSMDYLSAFPSCSCVKRVTRHPRLHPRNGEKKDVKAVIYRSSLPARMHL